MGIFSFFRSKPKGSAATAKERLQVLIAHQHADSDGPDYLPLLKQDILNVIKKYVDIGEEQVLVQLDSQDDCDVLELNITLPEDGERSSAVDAKALRDNDDDGPQSSKNRQSRAERTRSRQTRKSQASARSQAKQKA